MKKSSKIEGNRQVDATCFMAIGCITGTAVDEYDRYFIMDFQAASGASRAIAVPVSGARDLIELLQSTLDDIESAGN